MNRLCESIQADSRVCRTVASIKTNGPCSKSPCQSALGNSRVHRQRTFSLATPSRIRVAPWIRRWRNRVALGSVAPNSALSIWLMTRSERMGCSRLSSIARTTRAWVDRLAFPRSERGCLTIPWKPSCRIRRSQRQSVRTETLARFPLKQTVRIT